ncbi:malate synthase A [Nesterenkonia halotolerans]|uniref:Malate synthase n=1 Tax=Nesterenkonia halotolerans TaxID=225325 RepID=A0ABR9J8E5_9MICC|nr:malate synthase A [Nesterenkonia halotolerans]MBE1515272.1 malate synthase [Nesterenkonia halotolerans]
MSITVHAPYEVPGVEAILTEEALAFLEELHRHFATTRDQLLQNRRSAQEEAAHTGTVDFPTETRQVRESAWTVADHPAALQDRRVEITGPTAPAKMAINALNSGAKVWLACLEDALAPNWFNVIDAQRNLAGAAAGTLAFTSAEGKSYSIREDIETPTVVVRPRGWHLPEKHIEIDGRPAVGALVDFGLHFFHNARTLSDQGLGPFYYLPKLEHYAEARLWDQVFSFAEKSLGIDHGTVRATVLIETLPAAFHMEEILYELRDHASGLNAGRWDYLFSMIKYFRASGEKFVLPDRAQVSMTQPFMRAYTELLVKTCHKRGAFAMGGMAAFIPNRREPEVTAQAIEKVRADKSREAADGFDGSWVAHPDLVDLCRAEFNAVLQEAPNQLQRQRDDVNVSAADLLDVAAAEGDVTEAGVRMNLYVAVYYTAIWLSGNGAVAIHNLMEDAATAEISRSQVWQQIHNGTVTADSGVRVTAELAASLLDEEVARLRTEIDDEQTFSDYFEPAAGVVRALVLDEEYIDFLTLPAYELMP